MSKLKVGMLLKSKIGGDTVQITQSSFCMGSEKDKEGNLNEYRKEYVFSGVIKTPGPKRAKDKDGNFLPAPKGLKWDQNGKCWGKKKDKSYDLVI